MTTIDDDVKHFADVWQRAQKAATESLGVGKPFLGAFGGVADALYARNTPEWEMAISAAYQVFKRVDIYVDANGVQVAKG